MQKIPRLDALTRRLVHRARPTTLSFMRRILGVLNNRVLVENDDKTTDNLSLFVDDKGKLLALTPEQVEQKLPGSESS